MGFFMVGSAQHIDAATLGELKEVMGEDFSLLIETFINDSGTRIQALRDALASGEAEDIRRAAHSFKGSASNMGAPQLAEFCKVLEDKGREGELDGVEQLVESIEQEFSVVEAALAEL